MFLNDDPPITGGRELWGFPKKLAQPTLHVEIDTLVGTLDYGPVRIATGTMGYKHKAADPAAVKASLVVRVLRGHGHVHLRPAFFRDAMSPRENINPQFPNAIVGSVPFVCISHWHRR